MKSEKYKCTEVKTLNYLDMRYKNNIDRDVYLGLTSSPKYLPCKYFYDACGSQLFEDICELPEYYLTNVEVQILQRAAPQIMEMPANMDLVELGSGSNRKIRILLEAAGEQNRATMRYVPVDISESAIVEAAEELTWLYPELEVLGIVADFTSQLDMLPNHQPELLCLLGSTIGNFGEQDGVSLLEGISSRMKPDDRLIVGFDMIKPKEIIEAAYNDTQGITAAFNRNVLNVLNNELDASFDPYSFDHLAFFNDDHRRIEMHLRAKQDISVSIDSIGITIELQEGETIHTENSRKFTPSSIEGMVRGAGLSIANWYSDTDGWFSIVEMVATKYTSVRQSR